MHLALSRRTRRALTLLELVVVLTVLVAVGGIVISMVPNMLGRSHMAACSTNIPELSKAIEQYMALRGKYPDRYDSLRYVNNDQVTYLPAMAMDKGMGMATFVDNALVTSPTFTDEDVAALSKAGITSVVPMLDQPATPGDWSASIWPYSASRSTPPTAVPITTTNLNQVKNEVARTVLGQDDSAGCRYVIFGIGSQCTMIGVTCHEAPTAFVANMSLSANDQYFRYGAVYKVADSTGSSLRQAKFAGTVMISPKGIRNAEQHVAEWYNINADESK